MSHLIMAFCYCKHNEHDIGSNRTGKNDNESSWFNPAFMLLRVERISYEKSWFRVRLAQ